MSTILKALRRLEEEKAAGAPRELREEVAALPPSRSRSRSRLWLPGAALAGLLAVAGAWWGLAPRGESEAVAPVARVQEPAAQPSETPTPPAAPEIPTLPVLPVLPILPELRPAPPQGEVAGLPSQAFASRVEVVNRPAAKPRIPMEEPAAPILDAPPSPEPPLSNALPAPSARPAASAPTDPAPKIAASTEPVPAPQPAPPELKPARVARVPAPTSPAPAPDPPAPSRAPVDQALAPPVSNAQSVPSLRVEKTLWHPRPDRREAVIVVDGGSPRRIHEGDVVAGTLVSEIQPSGVVFERDGETLRRGVGD